LRIDSAPFYLNPIPEPGCYAEIAGPEAFHAGKSRRLTTGDHLYLMDGKGTMAMARIINQLPRGGVLKILIVESECHRSPDPRVMLASAIAKGDRQSVLLSMTVQMGISQYIPLECTHSAVRYTPYMQKRWKKVILQSCKQCRQPYIPGISQSMTLEGLCQSNGESMSKGTCLIIAGDPEGESIESLGPLNLSILEEIILMVGPEGGFSDSEKQFLRDQKILELRLSEHTLRIETAAIAICAAIRQQIISRR